METALSERVPYPQSHWPIGCVDPLLRSRSSSPLKPVRRDMRSSIGVRPYLEAHLSMLPDYRESRPSPTLSWIQEGENHQWASRLLLSLRSHCKL